MAERFYIFDGYNLLHAEPELKKLLGQNLALARELLIEQVLNFLGQEQGILAFDGPNEIFSRENYTDNLQIYFGKSADLVIEKVVKTLPKTAELVLLSSDNTLLTGILGGHQLVQRIPALEFWQRVKALPKNYSARQINNSSLFDRLDKNTYQKLDELRQN